MRVISLGSFGGLYCAPLRAGRALTNLSLFRLDNNRETADLHKYDIL